MSRNIQSESQPDRRHHRRPEREKRRKRGARIDPHGYDAGKKIKGKKRHILVDTMGLLLHAIVHSAGIQDRDGGILLLATMKGLFPFLEKLFADAASCSESSVTPDEVLKRTLRGVARLYPCRARAEPP